MNKSDYVCGRKPCYMLAGPNIIVFADNTMVRDIIWPLHKHQRSAAGDQAQCAGVYRVCAQVCCRWYVCWHARFSTWELRGVHVRHIWLLRCAVMCAFVCVCVHVCEHRCLSGFKYKAAAEDLSSNKSFLVMWHCRKVICLAVLLDSALVCPIPCKHAVGILICLEIY